MITRLCLFLFAMFLYLELKVSKDIWKTIPVFIPYGKNPVFAEAGAWKIYFRNVYSVHCGIKLNISELELQGMSELKRQIYFFHL